MPHQQYRSVSLRIKNNNLYHSKQRETSLSILCGFSISACKVWGTAVPVFSSNWKFCLRQYHINGHKRPVLELLYRLEPQEEEFCPLQFTITWPSWIEGLLCWWLVNKWQIILHSPSRLAIVTTDMEHYQEHSLWMDLKRKKACMLSKYRLVVFLYIQYWRQVCLVITLNTWHHNLHHHHSTASMEQLAA
jgi:hypothetical protein